MKVKYGIDINYFNSTDKRPKYTHVIYLLLFFHVLIISNNTKVPQTKSNNGESILRWILIKMVLYDWGF